MNIPDTLSAMLEDSTDRVAHKLAPLACSFPSLRDLFSDPALIEHFRRYAFPTSPDFEGFETSADLIFALRIIARSDLTTPATAHAAKFILGVSGRRGVFDLFEALARWDGAHRAAFVAWAGAQ